ncbi:MAG: GIY-YIG nuclease family protein [bacterium]|nr:GIY-YIG nuclease family protein [bacterium]
MTTASPDGPQDTVAAPRCPGVYIMKDTAGQVLYVGKAHDLRSRVRSYFREKGDGRPSVAILRDKVRTVEYVTTRTDQQAALLEDKLIKEYQPRYNIDLKDDKRFISVKVTLQEEFPRVLLVHQRTDDGALYFGPFTVTATARALVRAVLEKFQLRRCTGAHCRANGPCMYAQIDACSAPCAGRIPKDEYLARVHKAMLHVQRAQELQLVEPQAAKNPEP